MEKKPPLHLVFLCIRNRVRSVFSEFFFAKMLAERHAELVREVKVSSAGFFSKKLKDQLISMHVSIPEPFYNQPMAEPTRLELLKRDIDVSREWRSKELTPGMVKSAHLIVTALPEQKEELIDLFPDARSKIVTAREMSEWDGYLIFEDRTGLPMDDSYWDYVEENPDFVSKVISELEETLVRAFPNILRHLGLESRGGKVPTERRNNHGRRKL